MISESIAKHVPFQRQRTQDCLAPKPEFLPAPIAIIENKAVRLGRLRMSVIAILVVMTIA